MAKRGGAVHVVTTVRKYKGKDYRTHLLRRSYREGGKVKNETVANLSHLPDHIIDLIKRGLRGEQLVESSEMFDVLSSPQHGHVHAIRAAMRRLEFDRLLHAKPCRQRSLVLAMVAARIIEPQSKLATTRWWHTTTIPETFGVTDANEDDLYTALDWLLERQPAIEKKLAARHLEEGGLVLYDLSSSYFEGHCCPLAARGHSRDGKKGTLQVNYGLVTDAVGCPVSVSVFPGSTGDPTTLLAEVEKVRSRFGLEAMVVVGDRGMISQKQINQLKKIPGTDWVTALRSMSINALVEQGAIQLGLFDERNLFELSHTDYPGERLIACRNPELADRRAKKRQSLLDATKAKLQKLSKRVESGKLRGAAAIGVKVGRVLNAHKVGKHFDVEITDDGLLYSVNESRVAAEAALDGIYVIRTSVPDKKLAASAVVQTYKSLSSVERAFRSLKTIDLHVRPIRHWNPGRVRAHIFLCMLAYYVQFHMQEAWRSLLFFDEDLWTREREDAVSPAPRSKSAETKDSTRKTPSGGVVHSFRTLLSALGGIVRNVCRRKGASPDEPTITLETKSAGVQAEAISLVEQITL